jgi:hypothetical protein
LLETSSVRERLKITCRWVLMLEGQKWYVWFTLLGASEQEICWNASFTDFSPSSAPTGMKARVAVSFD